jgi:hypothetical protein
MSKDNSTTATAEKRPVSLLEQAGAVKEYKPDFENSKKFYEILEAVANRAAAIGSKMMMKRAQVMRMETDNAEVTARSNPEQAAKNILEIGKMFQELKKMSEEQQIFQAEYRRLKALADSINIPESEPHNRPIKLDGSNETRRALL